MIITLVLNKTFTINTETDTEMADWLKTKMRESEDMDEESEVVFDAVSLKDLVEEIMSQEGPDGLIGDLGDIDETDFTVTVS